MKKRHGFVSNSSSTAFMIVNTSGELRNLYDFVKENPQLVEEFNSGYGYEHTQEEMLACARQRVDSDNSENQFDPKEAKVMVFGDEDGDVLGKVFDYILREYDESKNFTWRFEEYHR